MPRTVNPTLKHGYIREVAHLESRRIVVGDIGKRPWRQADLIVEGLAGY
jgi:hypothetical protein